VNRDPCNENSAVFPVMKTGFSLGEKLHWENPVFITGMGLQCIKKLRDSRMCFANAFLRSKPK
jgi:hypothetical protein